MVRAWKSGKRPRNKFEAYHFGIENLLVETNAAHQTRGSAAVAVKELRRAAGAACATLLLADAEAVSRVWDGITSGPLAPMTTDKTAMLISAVGARFPNAGQRLGATYGQHNDYDAAEIVAGQIKHLASLDDGQAGPRLAQLASDPTLTSNRDLIRHHLAQRVRQRREVAHLQSTAASTDSPSPSVPSRTAVARVALRHQSVKLTAI